jgi:hypothetical protein
MLPPVDTETLQPEPYPYLWTPRHHAPVTMLLHPSLATSLDRLDDWGVYLVCASGKLAHARHYAGYANPSILERVLEHTLGTSGCHLPDAYRMAGFEIRLARIWLHKQKLFERALKLRNDLTPFCPFCNPRHWWTNEVHPRPDQLLRRAKYRHLWPKIAEELAVKPHPDC